MSTVRKGQEVIAIKMPAPAGAACSGKCHMAATNTTASGARRAIGDDLPFPELSELLPRSRSCPAAEAGHAAGAKPSRMQRMRWHQYKGNERHHSLRESARLIHVRCREETDRGGNQS
jgi:hypothetical protein